jgi:hypothetical protein
VAEGKSLRKITQRRGITMDTVNGKILRDLGAISFIFRKKLMKFAFI